MKYGSWVNILACGNPVVPVLTWKNSYFFSCIVFSSIRKISWHFGVYVFLASVGASQVVLVERTCLPMQETQETQVRSLDWEDSLKKEIATHSSILAWRIPWREEPGVLQFMRSQRVRHYWSNRANTHLGICFG